MFALTRVAEGLFVGHLWLIGSFLVGAAVFPWAGRESTVSPRKAMMHVAVTCGAGIAVFGFVLLILAAVGLLRPLPIVLSFCALLLVPALRQSPRLTVAYWRRCLDQLFRCWDGPSLALYYAMLVFAIPAEIANVGGDPIHYHLAYAEDWARSGKLSVDALLRFPFYASNFVLYYSAFFELHLDAFINFLGWATGLLTALCVYAVTSDALDGAVESRWAQATAFFLSLAVTSAPMYERWMDTAYMDVQIGAIVLLTATAMYIAAKERSTNWLFVAALIAGYLAGLKASFLLLIPIFAVFLFATARHIGMKRKPLAAALFILVVSSSPWYVRNFVAAGDPAPPAFNLAFHGTDGLVDKSEWAAIQSDLGTTRSANAFLTLPWRAYTLAPVSLDFRDVGISTLIFLLYVPSIVLLIAFAFGRSLPFGEALLIVLLCLLEAYWFAISTLLRYALVFFPLLAVCAAFCLKFAALRRNWGPLLTAVALVLAIPSPNAFQWYHDRFVVYYKDLPKAYPSEDTYLAQNDNGYAEEQFTVNAMRKRQLHGVVYCLGGDVEYFFRRDGIESGGDWIGPGGYFRLYRAIDAGQAVRYLHGLNVSAVLVDPRRALGGLEVPLREQLAAGGYVQLTIPNSRFQLFVLASHGRGQDGAGTS